MKISMGDMLAIESVPGHDERIFQAAIAYARAGIPVVPLLPNEKILPGSNTGINYTSATTKVETVKRWFDPQKGKFHGYNIGIVTGKEGGVFALDVDIKQNRNGFETLDLMQKENGEIIAPMAITPSGGRHFLFLWQEYALSSSDKVANGIDTRGGHADRYTGHIVAFPSMINGKMYKWLRDGDIGDIPVWVMEKLGASSWKKTAKREVGPEEHVPEEQLRRMLDYIDPNELSYDDWVKIGMGIKTQYPGKDGLDIWDAWSATGARHKENECRIRWSGFDKDGMVRVGTIFYQAREGGWEPQIGDVVPSTGGTNAEIAIEEMNEQYALVCVGKWVGIVKEYSLTEMDQNHRRNGEYDTHKLLGIEDFKILTANNKIEVWVNDKLKQIPVSALWLSHPSRREYEHGTGYYPSGKIPKGKFNLWQGFATDPIDGIPTKYLDHLRSIICNGKEDIYEWVLDWMADTVQDTANLKGCCVVLRGAEGCGKGTWADYFGKIFGRHYKHLIDTRHLTGNFNSHMAGTAVVFADEIFWPGNRASSNKLKGMVTESKIQVERKGVDVEPMENLAHIIIASNEDWVIPAGPESRRYLVLEVPPTRIGDTRYFNAIEEEMKGDGLGQLLHFLQNRKIKSNLRVAPVTEALRSQRMMDRESHDPTIIWLMERIEMRGFTTPDLSATIDSAGEWPSRVQSMLFYQEFVDWANLRRLSARDIRGPELFRKSLESFGFRKSRNSKYSFFYVPKLDILEEKFYEHIEKET